MSPPVYLHASSLRRAFKRIVLGGVVVHTALSAACGGEVVSENDDIVARCRPVDEGRRNICGVFHVKLTGDLNACPVARNGTGSSSECKAICGEDIQGCTRDGDRVDCDTGCRVGRCYAGLDDANAPVAFDVGSHLARMAFFEAASIDSFALLERELAAHGAPARLVRACGRARRDEVRHARMTAGLARRYGAPIVEPPVLAHGPPRSLEAIATENAVEGCVRETFCVLVGLWQAERAPTRELRALFAALATDEARHASLAARLDAWMMPRLSASARRRVEAARAAALAELEAALGALPVRGVGLPSPAEARTLLDGWRALPLAA